MQNSLIQGDTKEVIDFQKIGDYCDVFVLAAGFEDRAKAILEKTKFKSDAKCILIRYLNSVENNDKIFEFYKDVADAKFKRKNVIIVDLRQGEEGRFEHNFLAAFQSVPFEAVQVGIDISGMPAYATLTVLKVVRDQRPTYKQAVFYTAAAEYTPTYAEYADLVKSNKTEEIDLVPRSLALEMSENLLLDSFSGYRSQSAKAFLAIFAGCEVHRSAGVIDAINPSRLLLLYGDPGDTSLAWRLDMSKRLHKRFENGRMCATMDVSTLQIKPAIALLEQFYKYSTDEYDMVIAPICSKMHAVASYLFWEKYPEVQITFPLPIGYKIANCPKGTAKSYMTTLNEKQYLYRQDY